MTGVKTQHCPNCEATEQKLHDFRQEVSDAIVLEFKGFHQSQCGVLKQFIISTPKPDPLMEVIETLDKYMWTDTKGYVECFHEALKKHGLEIREKNDG